MVYVQSLPNNLRTYQQQPEYQLLTWDLILQRYSNNGCLYRSRNGHRPWQLLCLKVGDVEHICGRELTHTSCRTPRSYMLRMLRNAGTHMGYWFRPMLLWMQLRYRHPPFSYGSVVRYSHIHIHVGRSRQGVYVDRGTGRQFWNTPIEVAKPRASERNVWQVLGPQHKA